MAKEINVLAISYGRNLFDQDNAERKRMELCASRVQSYHMVIFSKRSDCVSVTEGMNGLILHPTNSKTRLHMIGDAVRIGSSILKQRVGKWVITSQDPFEAGLVGYVLKRRYAVTLNVQEHGDFFSLHHWKKESAHNYLRYYFGKWLLLRADTVRVVSKRIALTIERLGVLPEKIVFLPVRTDGAVTSDSESTIDLRAEYPDASVIVLSMARFVSQKNLTLLIKAFSELFKKDSLAKLVLIGSGAEDRKLRKLVTELHLERAVVFKNWTDEPGAYLQTADIYALSSNYEGWGRVLVEAMLAGTPVVTTDVGCAGEVLIDGTHGFVVPVGDVEAFSERLVHLATDAGTRQHFAISEKKDVQTVHISSEEYTAKWADVLFKTVEK